MTTTKNTPASGSHSPGQGITRKEGNHEYCSICQRPKSPDARKLCVYCQIGWVPNPQ